MKKFPFLLLLLLFIGISCNQTNDTQDLLKAEYGDVEFKKANNQFVPFQGTFEVYVDEILHNGPPPPKVQIALGTGNATHLGNSDVYLFQKWWPPGPPPYTFPWSGTGIGDIEFTAANGDVLKAYYNDAVAEHVSPTLVYVSLTGHFINGGTGRFANAEGYFNWNVTFYPEENHGDVVCEGEIMFSKN
jgi:hypothetical protein